MSFLHAWWESRRAITKGFAPSFDEALAHRRYPREPLADPLGYARDYTDLYGWRLTRAQLEDLHTRKAGDTRAMMKVVL
jgi:hypothetical protein